MAHSYTQRDLVGTVGRVTRVKVVATVEASDTTGSHTFDRAFRTAPELIGCTRSDDVSSVILGRVHDITTTGFSLTHASATGSEVFECVFEGELA